MARVAEAIRGRRATGPVVVIAHAGVIRAAVALALELTPVQALRLQIEPLSLTRLCRFQLPDDGEDVWDVRCINQTLGGVEES
jgi:alpha-ribazole phosphatase